MISVVIPSYRVKDRILAVLSAIGPEVARIYVVDDCCPENSGAYVRASVADPRVIVHRNVKNLGVGGATLTGFLLAYKDGADVIVKLDGDGQMDPRQIPTIVRSLVSGQADFAKGNRFYSPSLLKEMPYLRLFGNSMLSFMSKLSTGYWRVMDPTNGFFAIHARLLPILPIQKIERRYFFESDLLFRLNTIRAKVVDVPLAARYRGENSSLKISHVVLPFLLKHLTRFFKRIGYSYFLRDFNVGTVQLVGALFFLGLGGGFGLYKWAEYSSRNEMAPTGTVVLSAMLVILGFQLLISAINVDILNEPAEPIHADLPRDVLPFYLMSEEQTEFTGDLASAPAQNIGEQEV